MKAVARSVLLGAMVLSATGLACGSGASAPVAKRETFPQWQDVFDGTPEIYAVIRPQAIKRDAVYGSLFRSVMQMAQARSEMRGVTSLEALEGAEEIVVGIRRDAQGEDAALVLRGVPASLDAAKMTDATGRPILRLVDPRAKIPEYEFLDRTNATSGSVFVLPDRTWVGAIGEARARARQAFASPFGRSAPNADAAASALAVVRFDAATFLAGPRFAKNALVGSLTRKLRALTLALMPSKGGVIATLQYADEDASAWAEMHVKRLLEELATARPSLVWLKDAKVGHEGHGVVVHLPVPTRLLEDLPRASGGDLSL